MHQTICYLLQGCQYQSLCPRKYPSSYTALQEAHLSLPDFRASSALFWCSKSLSKMAWHPGHRNSKRAQLISEHLTSALNGFLTFREGGDMSWPHEQHLASLLVSLLSCSELTCLVCPSASLWRALASSIHGRREPPTSTSQPKVQARQDQCLIETRARRILSSLRAAFLVCYPWKSCSVPKIT